MTAWWSRLRRTVQGPPSIDWRAEATIQAERRAQAEREADSLRAALQSAAIALRKAEEVLHEAADDASVRLREIGS